MLAAIIIILVIFGIANIVFTFIFGEKIKQARKHALIRCGNILTIVGIAGMAVTSFIYFWALIFTGIFSGWHSDLVVSSRVGGAIDTYTISLESKDKLNSKLVLGISSYEAVTFTDTRYFSESDYKSIVVDGVKLSAVEGQYTINPGYHVITFDYTIELSTAYKGDSAGFKIRDKSKNVVVSTGLERHGNMIVTKNTPKKYYVPAYEQYMSICYVGFATVAVVALTTIGALVFTFVNKKEDY